MTALQAAEVAGLTWLGNEIKTNEAGWEADLAPVNVVIENDAVKLADEAFAKLPAFIAGAVDAMLAKYSALLGPELVTLEGEGLTYLANFALTTAAKIAAA